MVASCEGWSFLCPEDFSGPSGWSLVLQVSKDNEMRWQLYSSEIEGLLCTARADAHLAVTELLKQKLCLPAAAQQIWSLTELLAAMREEPCACFRFNGTPHDGRWNTALGGEEEVKIHSVPSKKHLWTMKYTLDGERCIRRVSKGELQQGSIKNRGQNLPDLTEH